MNADTAQTLPRALAEFADVLLRVADVLAITPEADDGGHRFPSDLSRFALWS
jgi:hypothetical protein